MPVEAGSTAVIFLTAASSGGEVSRIRVSYYTDPRPDRRPTLELGPGTAPALSSDALCQLLVTLGAWG